MKSIKLFLLIFCIGLILSFQVDGQTPWETTGNSTISTDFLGTTNIQNLNFKTNSQFRMRLMNTTGYLGVGSQTFTPSASLHLNLLSYTINSGNLIRTDGKSSLDLSWAMYSGTNVGNSVQKARFLLSPLTNTQNDDYDTGMINSAVNHLQVESTLGDVVFKAHGANSSTGTGELIERMRITSALFTDPHWGAQSVSTTRVSISARPNRTIVEPLAMLHIGEPWYYQKGGHREWMNSGVYVNRSNDNVFFGMRPRENTTNSDHNDAIIAWGDNDSPPGKEDGLRVVFCGPFSGGAIPGNGAHMNGFETMRFHPLGNIGMGDFSVNGLNQMPTEKLDIVGKLRVRDVPVNPTPEVLIVGQEIDSVGDYVLNHLAFPNDDTKFLSGTGEWINVGGSGGDFDWITDGVDVWSGVVSGTYPPGKVGIGIVGAASRAKLHVLANQKTDNVGAIGIKTVSNAQDPTGFINFGHWTEVLKGIQGNYGYYTLMSDGNTTTNVGHYLRIEGSGINSNTGTEIYVTGAGGVSPSSNTGVVVDAISTSNPALNNFGVKAKACGATNNYAIYGETCSSSSGGANWAGYFNGDTYATGLYLGSDANIKQDIQEIPNASEILSLLNPKSYYFQEHETLSLSSTKQYGLIAQELEEVLPELVKNAVLPLIIDSLGNITRDELTIKSVRYNDLIPILIAGFQEQNASVTDQEAQIAIQNETIANLEAQLEAQASEMEQQATQLEQMQNDMQSVLAAVQTMQQKIEDADQRVSTCCTPKTGSGETGVLINENHKELELQQNVPNPFDDQTRITFNLPQTADVILEITDATGRPLERLIDGNMSSGEHTTLWDGSKVASGIYFYTLYADGELITKKMIKH